MWIIASALAGSGLVAIYLTKNTSQGNRLIINAVETCCEYYTDLRMRYYQYTTPLIEEMNIPEINNIRIISGERMVIIPPDHYDPLIYYNWNQLNNIYLDQTAIELADSLLHIEYSFQGQKYRVVTSQRLNQNIEKLMELSWVHSGFCTEIDNITGNLTHTHLSEILEKYAGPLGDFYINQGIEQDPRGFLDLNLTTRLFKRGHKVTIEDPLGETISFAVPPQTSSTHQ